MLIKKNSNEPHSIGTLSNTKMQLSTSKFNFEMMQLNIRQKKGNITVLE